jgi:hypothetical protein
MLTAVEELIELLNKITKQFLDQITLHLRREHLIERKFFDHQIEVKSHAVFYVAADFCLHHIRKSNIFISLLDPQDPVYSVLEVLPHLRVIGVVHFFD